MGVEILVCSLPGALPAEIIVHDQNTPGDQPWIQVVQFRPGGRKPVSIEAQQGDRPGRRRRGKGVLDLALNEMEPAFGIAGEREIAPDFIDAVTDPGRLADCVAPLAPTPVCRLAKPPAV